MNVEILPIRLLIFGGRNLDLYRATTWLIDHAHDALRRELDQDFNIDLVIEGGATGADRAGREFAKHFGLPLQTFPAAWKTHGNAAGPIRNKQMIDEGKPSIAIGLPGNRGTRNMAKQCVARGVRLIKLETLEWPL